MRCTSTAEAGADRGGVTAETAVALPSLVLVLGVALTAVQAGAVQVACVDAARTGARALARGEPEPAVRAAVARTAPDSAEVSMDEETGLARVTVVAPVGLGPLARLPIEVEGHAVTPLENHDVPALGPAPAPTAEAPADSADPTGPADPADPSIAPRPVATVDDPEHPDPETNRAPVPQ